MSRYRHLERFLEGRKVYRGVGLRFTNRDYREAEGFTAEEAHGDIMAFQAAQRAKRSETQYTIVRVAGTRGSKSIWEAHSRADRESPARIADTIRSDMLAKSSSFKKDLQRLADLDPDHSHKVFAQRTALEEAVEEFERILQEV